MALSKASTNRHSAFLAMCWLRAPTVTHPEPTAPCSLSKHDPAVDGFVAVDHLRPRLFMLICLFESKTTRYRIGFPA